MRLILALLCALAAPALAETIRFTPTDADFPNPERGWWVFAADDLATASEAEIASVAEDGLTLAYGIVRLDDYRDRDLPPDLLAALAQRFGWSRDHGVKIILRFAYNYPDTAFDYSAAEDAPLPVVLRHIAALAPLIRDNADVIAVMQAGFIGAWGEGHSSSNGLDMPEAKAAIRDALYAAVPDRVPLQWRYPPDILSWPEGRMGFHNDCFLSSPDDVGTYSEDPDLRQAQRATMAALTDRTFFSGETCDSEAELARYDCDAVLEEGAEFHLSALGRDYYDRFHDTWRAQGCYAEVSRRMGYRLRLVNAELDGDVFLLTLANDGWARPVQPRAVWLTALSDGGEVGAVSLRGTVDQLGADQEMVFRGDLSGLGDAHRLCLSAPDLDPRLSGNPAFSIRFANADIPGQGWDAKAGAFCFDRD